jgi:hypothetical protein
VSAQSSAVERRNASDHAASRPSSTAASAR